MRVGALVFSLFVWGLLAALVAVFLYEAAIALRSLLRGGKAP